MFPQDIQRLAQQIVATATERGLMLTTAESCTGGLLAALLTGHWEQAEGISTHAMAVLGLIVGGLIAAPLAGIVARIAPRRALTYGVGVVVLISAGYQALRLFKVI